MDWSLLNNWQDRSFPLVWLPDDVRKKLRDALDTDGISGDTGFITFAGHFLYTFVEATAIADRSRVQDFSYSKTQALLFELHKKGRTIQDVQKVLIHMGVAAADIIPNNIEAIIHRGGMLQQQQQHQQQQQQQQQQQPSARNGRQNSEESQCCCSQCLQQRYSRSQSFDPAIHRNVPVTQTFERQSSVPQHGMNNLSTQCQCHQHSQYPQSCNVSEFHRGNRSRHSSMTNQQYNNDLEASTVITLSGCPPTSSRTNPLYNNDLETSTVNTSSGCPPTHHSGDTDQPIQSSRSLNGSNDNIDNDQRSTSVRSQHQNNNVDNESARTNTERPSINRGNISFTSSASMRQSSQPVGDSSTVPLQQQQQQLCSCDDCRLQSDPHETRVFTLASVPKTQCMRNSVVQNTCQVAPSTETGNPQNRIQQTANNSEQYVSQSTANIQDNGDVYGGGASSGRSDGARPKTSTCMCPGCKENGKEKNGARQRNHDEHSRKDNNRKKKLVCNATPRHVTGENPQGCRQCRQFLLDLQSRQHRSDGSGTTDSSAAGSEERHSWHGEGHSASANSTSTTSLSDSVLNMPDSRDANTIRSWREHLSNHGNFTIYSTRNRRKSVFVTYSWDGYDARHLEEVICLCERLKNGGVDVRFDMESSEFNRLCVNKIQWLDDMVENASYIIACISPAYYNDIQPTENASPQINRLNARYVFDKLRNEYYRNGAQNHRVIPVIFENSGATMDHVHSSMSSTVVYTYPQQLRSIVDHILQPPGHGLQRVIQNSDTAGTRL